MPHLTQARWLSVVVKVNSQTAITTFMTVQATIGLTQLFSYAASRHAVYCDF